MTKTLVLHIGDPKTGTSSIQQVLMDRAYDSPVRSLDYQPYLNAFPLANALYGEAGAPDPSTLFAELATWLRSSSTDVSVISAEMFFRVRPAVLQQALQRFLPELADSARIIAYVRPHASRFLSQFVQLSKTGMYWGDQATLYDRMMRRGNLLCVERFEAWRTIFADRFTLRPMIRDELHGRDVVADFFNTILQDAPFKLHPTGSFNESPSLEVLTGVRDMHRVLKKCDVALPMRQAVGQYMVNRLNSTMAVQGTKLRLNRALFELLSSACHADAAALDAAFFGRPLMAQVLADAAQDCVDRPMPLAVEHYYAPETLAELRRASRRLAGLLKEGGELWRADFFCAIKQRPSTPELRRRVEAGADKLDAIHKALAQVTAIITQKFLPFGG